MLALREYFWSNASWVPAGPPVTSSAQGGLMEALNRHLNHLTQMVILFGAILVFWRQ